MQHYLDSVRQQVCARCIDAIAYGSPQRVACGWTSGLQCPVEKFLPEVVQVVRRVSALESHSTGMEDYVVALRDEVCSQCEQSSEGICPLRMEAACALDRYFMLVADAILQVENGSLDEVAV